MTSAERQHPRYAHAVAIVVKSVAKPGTKPAKPTTGRTRNVSRGGLCANVDTAIAIGTDVMVDVTLVFDDDLRSDALTLPARVVWCTTVDDEYQVGLSFKPLDAKRAEVLQLFLTYLGEDRGSKSIGPRVEKSIDDQFR